MPSEKNAPLDPASLEIPAPVVNKFQILVAGGNVRIAFAEGFQGQPNNYRSAVAMSVADARELAVALIDSLPVTRNALTGLAGALAGGGIAGENYNYLTGPLGSPPGLINTPDPKKGR